jgi:transposase
MRPIGSAEDLERRRRRAVALLAEGLRQTEVARKLNTSSASVCRWNQMATKGMDGLAAIPRNPQRRLSPSQERELERLLLQGSRAHGWSNELWTATRVTKVIAENFGEKFHPEHVRKILKVRLGWSSQKPEHRARERDEEEIARWKREEFPRIKKRR